MDLNIKSLLKKIRRQSRFGACNVKIKLHAKSYFGAGNQGCGSGLILTGSGSDLSGQTGSGSNLSGHTGSGSRHLCLEHFLSIFFLTVPSQNFLLINHFKSPFCTLFFVTESGLKPDPDLEKFENQIRIRLQAKTLYIINI